MQKKFDYVIKVDGKRIWKGMNPKKKYSQLRKKYPSKRVSIAWETREKVLVCYQ